MAPVTTLGRRLARHHDAYLRALLVLALNVPLVGLLLLRDLRGIDHTPMGVTYLGFVVLGWYAFIPLAIITLTFALALFSRRLALLGAGTVVTLLVYYLAVDGFVYDIFKLHLDAFWLAHIFIDYDTMGIPGTALAAVILLLVVVGALEVGIFVLARRIRRPGQWAMGFVSAVLVSACCSQSIYMVAHERDHGQITVLTPRLPLYYPFTWHRQATKYGGLLSWALGPSQSSEHRDSQALRYPLRPLACPPADGKPPPNIVILLLESWRSDAMDAVVSPNIDALAGRGSNFLRHFSSGNSTPAGIFGLFFGIHPTYTPAVVAQSAAIDNPVLANLLRARGYALGIYAEHFERHKIADMMFRGIAVHDSFAGATPDERDADMTRQLESFVSAAARRHQPFLAFEFFKSTHYSYYYPPDDAPFQPTQELDYARPGSGEAVGRYLNDYRNSVHYVDRLVGDVVRRLESLGVMENTIIVVTGDHGEEFNDDGAGYWGHSGNFTSYQTRVPLVMVAPGQGPRRVSAVTMHVDIPATLIQAVCGGDQDAREYTNGMNLFRPLPAERPVVVSSYVNHAFILGDDVYAVLPVYVQRYKLDDIKTPAGVPRSDLVSAAMEEVTRFSGGRPERPAELSQSSPAVPRPGVRVAIRAAGVTTPVAPTPREAAAGPDPAADHPSGGRSDTRHRTRTN